MTRQQLLDRLYDAFPDCLDINVRVLADILTELSVGGIATRYFVSPEPERKSPAEVIAERMVTEGANCILVSHPTDPSYAPIRLSGNGNTAWSLRKYLVAFPEEVSQMKAEPNRPLFSPAPPPRK